ncbi:hypothetical protein ACFWMS_02065 [Peribacillus butanolivorans]|uniref:hypothetical protein n=1 Tax=Peribacillus butanolivorans TaxID=421767 RepID=UPI00365353F7
MQTVESKVQAVIFAKGKVMGKITAKGVEAVIGEFITKYQEAVEADTTKSFEKTLTNSYVEIKKHLKVLGVYDIAIKF